MVDHTLVNTKTQTNFPLMVSITDPDLASRAYGNDIFFTSDDGVTVLDYEIESFNAETGGLVAWIRIPSLSYTTNTSIYMYYGDPEATSKQNPEGVWDSNLQKKYFQNKDPNLTLKETIFDTIETVQNQLGRNFMVINEL